MSAWQNFMWLAAIIDGVLILGWVAVSIPGMVVDKEDSVNMVQIGICLRIILWDQRKLHYSLACWFP